MDIIEELKSYKQRLGFSNEEIAAGSGVPIGTVQKIFGGVTRSPRRKTLLALEAFFRDSYSDDILLGKAGKSSAPDHTYSFDGKENDDSSRVNENALAYDIDSETAAGAEDDSEPDWIIQKTPDDDPDFHGGIKLIFTRQGTYTIDDLDSLPEGVRVELIDGVLYQFNSPSLKHQTLVLEIATRLNQCAAEQGCKVFIAPIGVQLDRDEKTMVQPDILAICDRKQAIEIGITGAPVFITEVLSHSTRHRDLTIKLAKYEHAGVKEYWAVDPEHERILAYVFDDENVIYHYTFDDQIPVKVSDGKCVVDFHEIKEGLNWFDSEE